MTFRSVVVVVVVVVVFVLVFVDVGVILVKSSLSSRGKSPQQIAYEISHSTKGFLA